MKTLLIIILILNTLYARDGMKNIHLNTLDRDEAIKIVSKRVQKIKLTNLNNLSYAGHEKKLYALQYDISNIQRLNHKVKELQLTLKEDEEEYKKQQIRYKKNIDAIYNSSKYIQRVSYYLVSHKIGQEYSSDLQNYLLDKYSVTKFEQTTIIKQTTLGTSSFQNSISTTKEFGEMRVESLKDFTFRDRNLNLALLKVTQLPFLKAKDNKFSKLVNSDIDKFAQESGVKIEQLANKEDNNELFLDSFKFTKEDKSIVLTSLENDINKKVAKIRLSTSNQKIKKTIAKIEKKHDTQLVKSNNNARRISQQRVHLAQLNQELMLNTQELKELAKEYDIRFNFDELDKLVIISPKIYSEIVDLGEEKEFILRKAKAYINKITINNLTQSETLTDLTDLATKNSDLQKMIEFESIHIMPFVKDKKLSLFMFSIIEIEEKITEENYVKKEFKYATLEFVPIKREYKTIYALNTEITLGLMKEFLETRRENKYFDKYCLEDSTLPEEAKVITTVTPEYYNYPAVCYKLERIDEIVEWISEKTDKELVIPDVTDWSYIASNANSSDYCWGNHSIKTLNEDGVKHENIYHEDEVDTKIEPVKSYSKSILGMYDMGGNVHELVKSKSTYMIKGNSFISYIERSNAPAIEYEESLSPSLGLRLFYIKENLR